MNKDIFSRDFEQIYNANILPVMQELEPMRKKQFCKTIFIEIISIMGVLISLYLFNTLVINYPIIIYCLLLISSLGIAYIFEANKEFRNIIKSKYMTKIMQSILHIKWEKSKCIIKDAELINTKMFGKFDNVNVDDSFSGKYNGVKFKVQENKLSLEDKYFYFLSEIFKGVILSFSSNKKIKTNLIVSSCKNSMILNQFSILKFLLSYLVIYFVASLIFILIFGHDFFPILKSRILFDLIPALIISLILLSSNCIEKIHFKKIQLEDVEFEKKFVVLSGDEVEARYLLTTSFMERLNNLKTVFGSKNIKCSFVKDNISFAIQTNKDLFEFVSLYKPLTNIDTMKDFYAQLNAIFELIDYFKLDENTGL